MKRLLVFFLFFAVLPLLSSQENILETQNIPVSHLGRFRPLDSSSRLWLYEFYQREQIKKEHADRFQSPNRSALHLLWNLHFQGHQKWDHSPLFFIHLASIKSLLGLETNRSHFSFDELQSALAENRETNLALVKKLITYEFSKHLLETTNRGSNQKIELTSLTPNLWAQIKGQDLVVLAAPNNPPWHFLKPGMVLAPDFKKDELLIKKDKPLIDDILNLFNRLKEYAAYEGPVMASEKNLEEALDALKQKHLPPKEIAQTLENHAPLTSRMQQPGMTIKALPGRFSQGDWFSLKALKLKLYDRETQTLVPIRNFTSFSDDRFEKIQSTYLALEEAWNQIPRSPEKTQNLLHKLTDELKSGYASLAGTIYKEAAGKSLSYPSLTQIKMETIYYQYPFIEICIALYAMAVCFFFLNYKPLQINAFFCLIAAFLVHTFILGMRCFIVQRPPVSNMFETVIYVPWVAVLVSFFLSSVYKNRFVLIASSIAALALLILIKLTDVNSRLDNVQAVLDSQYWLIIHVLLVVGSYGVFILSGILAHFYLIGLVKEKEETPSLAFLSKIILQSLYLGVALLIPGTILGGVWAAESWGRFWDWDPKESWAFISACIYLIFIHAYTFHHIRHFGLAVGSITGLLAISFTWYGVNYILGTGLHTYGFGSGGEVFYYLYFAAELLFLFIIFFIRFLPGRKLVEKN